MSPRGRRGSGAAAMYAARMTDEIEVKDEDNPLLNAAPLEDEPAEDPADDIVTEDDAEDEPEPQIDLSHEEDEDEPEPVVADPVADLQKQLADLNAERAAEKAQRQQDDEAAQLRQHQQAIVTGHKQAQNAMTAAKASYAKAAAAGDWNAAAEAQAEIAQVTADLREFEAANDEIKAAISNVGKRKPAPTQQAQPDAFEQFIAPMSPKAQTWMRTNKADLLKSQARGLKAQAAHAEAIESGIEPDSAAYYAHLDKAMGYKPMTKQPQPKPTGQPRVAAPAGGRAAGGAVNEVRLSRAELDHCRAMNISPKRYAANKAEIIKNGKDPRRGGPVYTAQQPGARR